MVENKFLEEAINKLQARAYLMGVIGSINQNYTSKDDLYNICDVAFDLSIELSDCDIEEIYDCPDEWDYDSQLGKWKDEVIAQEDAILKEIKEMI